MGDSYRAPQPMEHTRLYPEIEPYRHGFLRVSPLHEIYYEECGNPRGKPALFLHGGPGAGAGERSRRFFDPSGYRVVLFDQRGCGRSRPHGSLTENTTCDLIADIEKLRLLMEVDEWLVFGGSWGATLSLLYAQSFPSHVSALVLRGIFLLRRPELHWIYQEGASALFPDRWEEFVAEIPVEERHDLLRAYHRRLTCDDPSVALPAAKAWSKWEATTSYLVPNEDEIRESSENRFALAIAKIESHYFINKGFLRDNQILADINKIRHIPAAIVQGRYDVVCPTITAWELHTAWPEASFTIVPSAGHSAFEPGITHELVTVTDGFLKHTGSRRRVIM